MACALQSAPQRQKLLSSPGCRLPLYMAGRSEYIARVQLPSSTLASLSIDSGSMALVLARLIQNGKGPRSVMTAKCKKLRCDKSFPRMRCPFDAVVKPTLSYGSEVWETLCFERVSVELKDRQQLQLGMFPPDLNKKHTETRSLLPLVFAALSEVPGMRTWWSHIIPRSSQACIDVPGQPSCRKVEQQHTRCCAWGLVS